jgi:orotate phosphoribosyltransferase
MLDAPHEPTGIVELLDGRSGHFQLESGHHGELWLDLDGLMLRPALLLPYVEVLAGRLAEAVEFDGVCGPLLGGALIASAVAATLDRELYVAEPAPPAGRTGDLFQARYAVPPPVRTRLAGRRVAVIDDVVNAGSATRATVTDLRAAGATVVAIGAMVVLGDRASGYAQHEGVPLAYVEALPNRIWAPDACPLCAGGEPLEDMRRSVQGTG